MGRYRGGRGETWLAVLLLVAGGAGLLVSLSHETGEPDPLIHSIAVSRRVPSVYTVETSTGSGEKVVVKHSGERDSLSVGRNGTTVEHVWTGVRSYLRIESVEPSLGDINGVWWVMEDGLKAQYPEWRDLVGGAKLERDAVAVKERVWRTKSAEVRVDSGGRIIRIDEGGGSLSVSYTEFDIPTPEGGEPIDQRGAEVLLERASAAQA